MSLGPEFDSLNSVKYLFLREISEPRDNSLRIVVDEAVANQRRTVSLGSELPELATLGKDAWPIESVEGCRTFELSWKRYVAYLVTEEMVGCAATIRNDSQKLERGKSSRRQSAPPEILQVNEPDRFVSG